MALPDTDQRFAGRLGFRHKLGPEAQLRSGTDVAVDRYRLELDEGLSRDFENLEELIPTRDEVVWGGYLDLVLRNSAGGTR